MTGHTHITGTALARRLAALKGFEFGGTYESPVPFLENRYFVPLRTLIGADLGAELGISGEHHLFGGFVPRAFMATKTITHPLIGPDAAAPEGWSHLFPEKVKEAVLYGFSAFTADDARRAGRQVLTRGPARLKPASGDGGHGQVEVSAAAELDRALDEMDAGDIEQHGIVVEENLTGEVTTYSIGRVIVGDMLACYCGTQTLTRNNAGGSAYGGSTLFVVRGDFDQLLSARISSGARHAVEQARLYDAAADECFPGFIASRRNYDIVLGTDSAGKQRSGVLEQSWRLGGASGAEISALEAFRDDPGLKAVRASCLEVYGDDSPAPAGARVHFRGDDPEVGLLTKYSMIEARYHAL